MDKGELKPCPFCGGLLEKHPVRDTGAIAWFHPGVVTDKNCILSGKGFYRDELGKWNTRALAKEDL